MLMQNSALTVTLERADQVEATLESAVRNIEDLSVVSGVPPRVDIDLCLILLSSCTPLVRPFSSSRLQPESSQGSSRGFGLCLPRIPLCKVSHICICNISCLSLFSFTSASQSFPKTGRR